MGKTRKPKAKVAQVNPIGIPSVREFNEELLASEDHPHGPIAAMVDQLQSISVEEKMCALQSLSFLCQNRQRIPEIVQSDIVKTIASWLMDPCKSIRNATAGALRNLSINGIEVCENLVEQDVLTPLLALLNEYALSPEWVPHFDGKMNNQMDEEADTFLQAINLVWNLCESTGIALNNFNQTRIVQSFIRYLDYNVFGLDICKCVFVVAMFGTQLISILTLIHSDCRRPMFGSHNRRQSSRLANSQQPRPRTVIASIYCGGGSFIHIAEHTSSCNMCQYSSVLGTAFKFNFPYTVENVEHQPQNHFGWRQQCHTAQCK